MAGGTVVGLDIGSQLMKVVELKKSGANIEVTALDVAPTPQEAFENGVIVDSQLLAKAVKELLSKARVSAKKVVSSVSGQSSVVVRVVEVAQMGPKELQETMKWEVERQVPFSAADAIMDFTPINRPEGLADGQNMEVLLAVGQREMIDRHADMILKSGLKPDAIEVEPIATGRALLEVPHNVTQAAGHTVGIINIGASNTDISIFRDKLLAFPRNVPMAGDTLTRAIADGLMVDMQTAEQYKRELGEVIFTQQAPQNQFGSGAFGGSEGFADFGGFTDFGTNQQSQFPVDPASPVTQAPEIPAAPGSGSMPFDFEAMGQEDAPLPGPTLDPFNQTVDPTAANPFAPVTGATGEPAPFGGEAPSVMPFDQTVSQPQSNLPVQASTQPAADPMREQLRIQIFNAMAPYLSELAQEVRRSLDYYRGKTSDAPIHELLLTGGSAKLKGLAQFFEAELGIPTRVANPLAGLTMGVKNQSQSVLDEMATLYPVCIGLAARDLVAVPVGPKMPKAPKAAKAPKTPKAPKPVKTK